MGGRLRKRQPRLKDLLLTAMCFSMIGCFADVVARFVLFNEGRNPPTWTRWVPFADLYFWWMK